MNIRIIAGKYGGRTIKSPSSFKTHPMSERARSAIFNKLIDKLKDADVLDAFAGTGALGLEALSRGAKRVVLVDRDRLAQRSISDNIDSLRLGKDEARLVGSNVSSIVNTWVGDRFDIIFSDPPYNDPQWSTVDRLQKLLKQGGILVVSRSKDDVSSKLENLILVDKRTYADAVIEYYKKEGDEKEKSI